MAQEWRKGLTFPLFLGILTCSLCVWRIESVSDLYEDMTEQWDKKVGRSGLYKFVAGVVAVDSGRGDWRAGGYG